MAAAHMAAVTLAWDPCAPALTVTSWMKTRRPALTSTTVPTPRAASRCVPTPLGDTSATVTLATGSALMAVRVRILTSVPWVIAAVSITVLIWLAPSSASVRLVTGWTRTAEAAPP